MSDTLTPRTDAIAGWIAVTPGRIHDLTNLSRTLERELAAMTRERDAFAERWRKMDEEVERLRALLRECLEDMTGFGHEENLDGRIRAALGEEGKIKIPSTSGPAATTQPECQAALGEE